MKTYNQNLHLPLLAGFRENILFWQKKVHAFIAKVHAFDLKVHAFVAKMHAFDLKVHAFDAKVHCFLGKHSLINLY